MGRLPRTAEPITNAVADRTRLDALVPEIHRRDFAWVVAMLTADGRRIDVFAHSWTNRELLLGEDGTAFALTPTYRYEQRDDLARAVEEVLPHRWDGRSPAFERHRPRATVATIPDADLVF